MSFKDPICCFVRTRIVGERGKDFYFEQYTRYRLLFRTVYQVEASISNSIPGTYKSSIISPPNVCTVGCSPCGARQLVDSRQSGYPSLCDHVSALDTRKELLVVGKNNNNNNNNNTTAAAPPALSPRPKYCSNSASQTPPGRQNYGTK